MKRDAGGRFAPRNGGRVIRIFGNPEPNELDLPDDAGHLSIGTAGAVAGYTPQVIIRLWTGGKNCCNIYWLIGFKPELRVLLDTTPYRFDDLEIARDIDGDGDVEFSFGTTTFDYFAAGYAYSPRAHAWFKFDRASAASSLQMISVFPKSKNRFGLTRRSSVGIHRRTLARPTTRSFAELSWTLCWHTSTPGTGAKHGPSLAASTANRTLRN